MKSIRLFFVFSFLLLFSVSINAYTLVLRGGGRIEIPDDFTVNNAGVTYAKGDGINITVQFTSIDIAATERENKETAGSLLSRIGRETKQETQAKVVSLTQGKQATKTITNLDLNAYRIARENNENAYEQNRAATGFPSREELQRRNEEESQKMRALGEQQVQQEEQAESYWRERATSLRTEINVLDAEISYVRARINQEPTYTVFYSYAPSVRHTHNAPNTVYEPSANSAAQRNFGVRGNVNFGGGQTRGSVGFNYQSSSVSFYPNNGIDAFGYYPYYGYAPPFPVRYQSYNRMQLVSQLQSLEQTRVGLVTRWRLLEDEARRAGAQPGWLR